MFPSLATVYLSLAFKTPKAGEYLAENDMTDMGTTIPSLKCKI